MVSKKKNPLYVWGWDRKIRPLQSPFVITRQASWWQSVILGTDFSIQPSHSWWILILLNHMSYLNKTWWEALGNTETQKCECNLIWSNIHYGHLCIILHMVISHILVHKSGPPGPLSPERSTGTWESGDKKYLNIAHVLQDEWLTTFTHPANTCTCPLKGCAIKNIRE